MRFPFITRAAHERILRACEDAALERLEAELAQSHRAHQDALDRYRGRMRPAARAEADQREIERAAMIAAKRTPMTTGVAAFEAMRLYVTRDHWKAV